MKVSVLAVVGAFRTGKSFVLDIFLQYLQYCEDHPDYDFGTHHSVAPPHHAAMAARVHRPPALLPRRWVPVGPIALLTSVVAWLHGCRVASRVQARRQRSPDSLRGCSHGRQWAALCVPVPHAPPPAALSSCVVGTALTCGVSSVCVSARPARRLATTTPASSGGRVTTA